MIGYVVFGRVRRFLESNFCFSSIKNFLTVFKNIMENEEKEDLLLDVTESEDEIYEKEEIDYYIEKKILDYLRNEKPNEKFRKKTLTFIATCLLVFLSSSILIVVVPIYLKYSSSTSISTYSKLVTLSLVNAVFFIIAHVVGVLSKCGSHTTSSYNLCLGDVLKISFLLSIGSILVFCLTDGNYLSCHLRDPLKGSSIVFSLLFYFVFSRKKMSLEKTFCAITITIGVFISVDFGICDKFLCNGNSNLTEVTPKFQFLYVVFYLLAHGIWVLHFVFIEVCWTTVKGCTSNLNVSVLSKVSCNVNSGTETLKPSVQSLSIICQEEQENQLAVKKEPLPQSKLNKKMFSHLKLPKSGKGSENSLSNSAPSRNQLSVPDFNRFPITSTPNNEMDAWQSWSSGRSYDLALWQHMTCCLIVLGLCWWPTLSVFHGGKGKLLVDVVTEVLDSFWGHLNWSSGSRYNYLPGMTVLFSVSYVMLILSSIEVLKITQSAVTVVSVMMAALPVASLFWSLFRLDGDPKSVLEFSPEITGEAVCAILGFPIIGIGIVLLMKSHVREFQFAI